MNEGLREIKESGGKIKYGDWIDKAKGGLYYTISHWLSLVNILIPSRITNPYTSLGWFGQRAKPLSESVSLASKNLKY